MGSNRIVYRILSTTTVAVSAAVLSTAVMLHLSGPSIVRFASSVISKMYGSLILWMTPPYLYVVINGIIISIAASSKFLNSSGSDHDDDVTGSGFESAAPAKKNEEEEDFAVVSAAVPVSEDEMKADNAVMEAKNRDEEEQEEFVISRSNWDPKKKETDAITEVATENVTEYSILTEKPLASARLGRRKSPKSSPEGGRALRVARPKRSGTLESTWKAITDGGAGPLARHLKKSDTWESGRTCGARGGPSSPGGPAAAAMGKSETFSGGVGGPRETSSPASSGPVRREPSLGRDELNRRVEAFINKFNEEMRMQRQESFNQYFQVINRRR